MSLFLFLPHPDSLRSSSSGKQEQEVARAVHQPERGDVQQLGQLPQEAVHPVPVRLRVQDGARRGAAGRQQQQRQQRGRRRQQEAGQDPAAVTWWGLITHWLLSFFFLFLFFFSFPLHVSALPSVGRQTTGAADQTTVQVSGSVGATEIRVLWET